MKHANPAILLSFDVEEFDLPLEYGQNIETPEQLALGKKGLDAVTQLLNQDITCTLFTTARFAVEFPEEIKQLAARHEIASHTYFHSSFENRHLLESRLELERITGTKVTGLRMPRMKKVEMSEVKKAGYLYDSSINPIFLPGRYNNLGLPRTLYMDQGIKRLPVSVSPHLRIPLFWLAFKNLPYTLFKMFALQTLQKDGYLCLYFHPWEFVDISGYKLPGYIKKPCGDLLLERLYRLVADLKQEGSFKPIRSFLQ